jgi:hypothetical protein
VTIHQDNTTDNSKAMPSKPRRPKRLPWDNEPIVDHKAATEWAITAAQPRHVDPNSPAVKAYSQRAFEAEIDTLSHTAPGERNMQLFKSAANLFEFVGAGALDEATVTDALRDACRDNRLEQDDGEHQVNATIASGRRHGLDSPRDLSNVGQHSGFAIEDAPAKTVSLDGAFDLARGFWARRDSLRHIYLAALSRMCSPWSVLAYCAARALALVRPNCVLPPIVGGPGSLNWFCATAARSGGGKSTSHAVARELLPHYVYSRNLGSGEGLVDAFLTKKTDDNPEGKRESVMFVADEIGSLAALGERPGSTLMETLKSAFSGETLGFSYRGKDTHLDAHTYRMTLVMNVQTACAGAVMDDKHSGTLQRFMWFPATDPRIISQNPPFPGKLTLPPFTSWQHPTTLAIPYEAIELIKDERARYASGLSGDDLAGHALFMREKLAYALAILDGRAEMNLDDWQLAGIASRVSDHTRAWVESELRTIQEEQDVERGRRQGVSQTAANETRAVREARFSKAAYDQAYDRIYSAGKHGITNRQLTRSIDSKLAAYLPDALRRLIDDGLIEKHKRTNKSGPATVVWALVTE